MSDLINTLKQFDLFKSLPDEVLVDLINQFVSVELAPNDVLFNKGDEGDALFLLQDGQLKAISTDSEGNEVVLNEVGPGAIIGEMALLDREPRSAGVVANTKATLLRLSREDFLSTMTTQPEMGLEIARNLVDRLRFSTTYIENAIEWSQLIAKGDYSFVEAATNQELENSEHQSDQERAQRLLASFFQMVEGVKAREEELRQELTRLKVVIDQVQRQADVAEISQSEFFQNLRKQKENRDDKND